MKLGDVVHLNGDESSSWVLMQLNKKTIKGMIKNKVFKWLPDKTNVMPKYKPYTKTRMESATEVNLKTLNALQAREFERLKKLGFCELEGI